MAMLEKSRITQIFEEYILSSFSRDVTKKFSAHTVPSSCGYEFILPCKTGIYSVTAGVAADSAAAASAARSCASTCASRSNSSRRMRSFCACCSSYAFCTRSFVYIFFFFGDPARIASRSTNLVFTLASRHDATTLRGDRGSDGDSIISLIPKTVPSSSFTTTVSLRGPENSTICTESGESLRMVLNSSTDAIGIAIADCRKENRPVAAAAQLVARNFLRWSFETSPPFSLDPIIKGMLRNSSRVVALLESGCG
mmetsp:Transcript_3591/g.7846  ORF Transcript_3591/g.7846 Transcript_3591/m.7846 type:complete len:254 (-) Transcript_3591:123-884(-)